MSLPTREILSIKSYIGRLLTYNMLNKELIRRGDIIKEDKLKLSNLQEEKSELSKNLANLNSDIVLLPDRGDLLFRRDETDKKLTEIKDEISFYVADIATSERRLKIDTRKYRRSNYISPKSLHNNQTKLSAIDNKEPYTDDEMIEIFLSCNTVGGYWADEKWLPDKDIEFYRRKFKRTYMAIEALVGVKIEYLKTGEISREVYWHDGKLDKTGLQMKRVLKELKERDKI